jgi:hypothetical protein
LKYPCPCCGYIVFREPVGSYDLCPLCGWEDDGVQLRHPALGGGANSSSLWEAQQRALAHLPLGRDLARGFGRDPQWRPLTEADYEASLARLSPGGHLPALTEPPVGSEYYWLAT